MNSFGLTINVEAAQHIRVKETRVRHYIYLPIYAAYSWNTSYRYVCEKKLQVVNN